MEDELDNLLHQKYTNPLKSGFTTVKNTLLPLAFKRFQREIENLEVHDEDVFITSFPKSGTTWTQEMVWLIMNDLDYEGAKVSLDKRFPHLECGALNDFKTFKEQNPKFEIDDHFINPVREIARTKGRRFVKTHLPWNLLPLQIQNQTKRPKIIHVFRNPKDACVSLHHHSKLLTASRGTLEDHFKLYLAGKVLFAPYWSNILSYWERRHLPNILFITYESMKQDLPSVIRDVAKFLEKEVPETQMKKLTHHLSFESMKDNPAVAKKELLEYIYQCIGEENRPKGSFVRAGKIGSYREQFTDDMDNIFEKWIIDNLTGTKLSIPN